MNAPFSNGKTSTHRHTVRGRQGVQNDESNPNFSEITTGLSQCAYGCSPLKRMVKSIKNIYIVGIAIKKDPLARLVK